MTKIELRSGIVENLTKGMSQLFDQDYEQSATYIKQILPEKTISAYRSPLEKKRYEVVRILTPNHLNTLRNPEPKSVLLYLLLLEAWIYQARDTLALNVIVSEDRAASDHFQWHVECILISALSMIRLLSKEAPICPSPNIYLDGDREEIHWEKTKRLPASTSFSREQRAFIVKISQLLDAFQQDENVRKSMLSVQMLVTTHTDSAS